MYTIRRGRCRFVFSLKHLRTSLKKTGSRTIRWRSSVGFATWCCDANRIFRTIIYYGDHQNWRSDHLSAADRISRDSYYARARQLKKLHIVPHVVYIYIWVYTPRKRPVKTSYREIRILYTYTFVFGRYIEIGSDTNLIISTELQ